MQEKVKFVQFSCPCIQVRKILRSLFNFSANTKAWINYVCWQLQVGWPINNNMFYVQSYTFVFFPNSALSAVLTWNIVFAGVENSNA